MAIQHKDIVDPDLHETKGVSTAPTGSFLGASSGVGVWSFPNSDLSIRIPDLSVAKSHYICSLYNGNILGFVAVIDGALGTANTVITPNIGGVDIAAAVITIPFAGSAAGNVITVYPVGGVGISANQAIQFKVNGASTNSVACNISILFQRTS